VIKIIGWHFKVDKLKHVLKTQYGIECNDITETYGGFDDKNTHYKIITDSKIYFLKVYDKSKVQTSQWIENIDTYIPILVWLNENTDLHGRIIHPYKTLQGGYRFEDDENVFLLFDYIEGETAGKTLTHSQLLEAAEILACLHNIGNDIPIPMDKIMEDFSVPFCFSLDRFMLKKYSSSPDYIKKILQPCLVQLMEKNDYVKSLSEKFKKMNFNMTLCHMDAHGYNLMQSEHLVLVDWEMAKFAPPELDLILFTKPDYWSIFIEHYHKFRPNFVLDKDLLTFYIHRRNIEDIWEFMNTILNNKQTNEQRQLELDLLSVCCRALSNSFFEL
jgi:thiamine kinase-like enzyme